MQITIAIDTKIKNILAKMYLQKYDTKIKVVHLMYMYIIVIA